MWITLFSIVIGIALGLAMGAVVMHSLRKRRARTGAVQRAACGLSGTPSFSSPSRLPMGGLRAAHRVVRAGPFYLLCIDTRTSGTLR